MWNLIIDILFFMMMTPIFGNNNNVVDIWMAGVNRNKQKKLFNIYNSIKEKVYKVRERERGRETGRHK